MNTTLENIRQNFKESLEAGHYDSKLAKQYFLQCIKENQMMILTPRGLYVYVRNENRYMFVKTSTKACVWLRKQMMALSPEAETTVYEKDLQVLLKELKTSPYIHGDDGEFDSRPDLINTASGVIQIKADGTINILNPNEVDAKFTVYINVRYIPEENRCYNSLIKLACGSFPAEVREESLFLLLQALGYLYSNNRSKNSCFIHAVMLIQVNRYCKLCFKKL